MSETPRHVVLLWALGLVAVVLLGARYLHHDSGASAGAAPPIHVAEAGGGSSRVVVHVAGAVRHPGVYRLPASSRVVDAVRRAGGARRHADLAALNLAAKVEDGRQVLVPLRGATPTAVGSTAAAGGSTAPAAPVDLNTATPDQLEQLDGIGPGMAAAILKYRQEHGGFGSVEELGEVPGIGEKRLASLREQVRV